MRSSSQELEERLVFTNRDLRISADEVEGGRVLIANPIVGKRYRVPRDVGKVLLFALVPRTSGELVKHAESLGLPAQRTLEDLLERDLITTADVPPALKASRVEWAAAGWDLAFDYEAATFDYPCLDYATEGAREDKARMLRFLSEAPEPNRYKDYGESSVVRDLPAPREASKLLDRPAETTRTAKLDALLSLTFCAVGYINHPAREPFILRTSPSGGGRCPSEGYVLQVPPEAQQAEWLHVRAGGRPALCTIGRSVSHEEALILFPGARHGDVVLIVTSQFDRNMYRYREPRTFRTVHMDAGHLVGTIDLVCDAFGWEPEYTYLEGAVGIESSLGLDPLREGHMARAVIGCGADHV